MAKINAETIGFVDRRCGVRSSPSDRKDRRLREVAPTKMMLFHEFAGRHPFAAWVVILVSLVA